MIWRGLTIVVSYFLIHVTPALAQDGGSSALEFFQRPEAWAGVVAGLLASRIIARLKDLNVFTLIPAERLKSLVTEIITLLLVFLAALTVQQFSDVLGLVDDLGLWQIILIAYPSAWGAFQVDVRRSRKPTETEYVELVDLDEVG